MSSQPLSQSSQGRSRKDDVSFLSFETSKGNAFPATSTPFNTPYKIRNQSLYLANKEEIEIKQAIRKLKRLTNQHWNIFHVSRIHNLSKSEASFKRYARRLKERLLSNITEGGAETYHISYTQIKDLQLNDVDHEALEVKVEKTSGNDKTSRVYRGIFLSWGASRSEANYNATVLPILLCQGSKGMMKHVHMGFQCIHDCFINSFSMQDEELRVLTVGVLANSSFDDSDLVKIKYDASFGKKSNALEFTLPTKILSRLWSSIHESSSEDWNDEEVNLFWSKLFNHTYRTFGLNLTMCGLCAVSLPQISFSKEMVTVKRKEIMHVLLCFLMSVDPSLNTVTPHVHEMVVP